jgi:hypothetical protein
MPGMPNRTYRLVEVREDHTRIVIATGMPADMAAQMRQLVATEKPKT